MKFYVASEYTYIVPIIIFIMPSVEISIEVCILLEQQVHTSMHISPNSDNGIML